ncbi:MAG: AbrB/MazE/SpoVT family DNA-binding domain-containing protein [Polyangia bacterium]
MLVATSKVTIQGQISVPAEVRKDLGIRAGTELIWDRNEDGDYTVRCPSPACHPGADGGRFWAEGDAYGVLAREHAHVGRALCVRVGLHSSRAQSSAAHVCRVGMAETDRGQAAQRS